MATCKDCIHYDLYLHTGNMRFNWSCDTDYDYTEAMEKVCPYFKDSSKFVEVTSSKSVTEERFRRCVQELIDIAKASESPSKVLLTTSESFASFACDLAKLEGMKEAADAVKGRNDNG